MNKKQITLQSILFLVIIIFCVVSSCHSTKNEELNNISNNIDCIIGKYLNIPKNLKTYKPFSKYDLDSTMLFNSDFKIYSLINASCGTCVASINGWKNLILKFKNFDISIILIFYSDDGFELLRFLCESKKIKDFNYPFFLDHDNSFKHLNEFTKKHNHFQTILTDKNNKILFLGNPVHSDGIRKLYLKKLAKSNK